MWWLAAISWAQDPASPDVAPIEVAAPAPATADELVDEARRRMLAGDYEGARLILGQAGERGPPPELVATIRYLDAYAWELDGDSARALAAYDALLAEEPTDDVRFRRAEALAGLGRTEDALAQLEALEAAGRPEADRLKIALLRTMWELDAQGKGRSLKEMDRLLDGADPGLVPAVQARARVVLLQRMVTTASALEFTGSDRQKRKALERRAVLVKGAQDQLVAIINLHDPATILAAFEGVVTAYEELGGALIAETPPPKLTPEQLAINRAGVQEQVVNVWLKASELADKAVTYAGTIGFHDDAVDRLTAARARVQARIEGL